jgi:hypothetical protein
MKDEDGSQKPFPMHTRDDLISQLISIRKKYPSYRGFGHATMSDLWAEKDREGAVIFKATDMNTSLITGKGTGTFNISALPQNAQMAPVYGMIAKDIDHDGNLDLVMVGNDFGMEPFTGRHDAFMGLYMKGNGKGGFTPLSVANSGIYVAGDGKGLASVQSAKDRDILIATQNQDSIKVFRSTGANPAKRNIKLKPDDFYADVTLKNGGKKHIEFYYGSTYLSQSSRVLELDGNAADVTITSYTGRKRKG